MSSIFLVIIGLSTFFVGYKIYSKFLARNIFDIYDKTVSVYESFIKANQSLDLAKTKIKHSVEIHKNTQHGFCFPERSAYAPEAAEATWAHLFEMWERQLKQPNK